jgi:hypothetical protein
MELRAAVTTGNVDWLSEAIGRNGRVYMYIKIILFRELASRRLLEKSQGIPSPQHVLYEQ